MSTFRVATEGALAAFRLHTITHTSSMTVGIPNGPKEGKPMARVARKEKKTYSLSRESIEFVERVKRERRRESASSALEELIQEKKMEAERSRMDASISSYYDSLTDEDREQNRAWGAFAESQLAKE
jgi:hypothetical protein